MFGVEHLHHPVPRIRTPVPGLQDAARLSLSNPPHRHPELPAEHQAMVSLGPVLCRLLPPGDGKVLLACPQRVLSQHCEFAFPPGVQPLFDAPADRLGCGDMTGLFKDHQLKDNEPLQVT